MNGPQRYDRDDSYTERIDRNFAEQLQELRVAQAGVQILFGFLLSLAFQTRFDTLDTFQLDVYLVTIIAAALAVICLTGPVAAHRLLFRRGVKDLLVRYTSTCTAVGLVFLLVAVIGGFLLVVDVLVNRPVAITLATTGTLIAGVLWVLVPIRIRRRYGQPEWQDQHERDENDQQRAEPATDADHGGRHSR